MISMDKIIEFAMDSTIQFKSEKEELSHLQNTKPILRDELLTCYAFLREKGLWDEYEEYRG